MAHSKVTLVLTGWTECSSVDGANLFLPEGGSRGAIPDAVRYCVETSAAECSDDKSVLLQGQIPSWYAAGVPISTGEKLFAKWVRPDDDNSEHYVVVS